jgi:hypothetical protein
MGDGMKFDFVVSKYAYKKAGEYTIKWKAVSSSGKQVSHSMKIVLKDEVTVTGTPICSVMQPTGGGNKDMNVMIDGFVPAKGSSDSSLQYDTYCGNSAVTFAYAGMEFDKPYIISGVEFTEGKHFRDGGWFASAPYVEILKDGKWVRAESVISKAYPGNSLEKQGEYFETYVFTFPAELECDGVRISGVPGGSACFISVGEIAPICEMKNDFEICSDGFEEIAKTLYLLGAKKAMLSGSGPTVFGIFESIEKAQKAKEKLEHPAFVCEIGI